jgi:transcriptional regulator with XRE-family HTH domain
VTGHRKWSEARESRSRRTDVPRSPSSADLQKKLSDYARSLGELRRARQMTQQQLAKAMQVSQAQISRVENQTDLYLSTLRSYIEAMGGELQIRVAFPGASWSEVTIGDVTDIDPPRADSEAESEARSAQAVTWRANLLPAGAPTSAGILKLFVSAEQAEGSPPEIASLNFPEVTNLNRIWHMRTDFLASSSACGFIVPKSEAERADAEKALIWRTAAEPLIPVDTDGFVSSAEFKEK